MLKVYSDHPNVSIYWDSDNQWVYVDWRNIPSTPDIQQGCEEMLALLKEKGSHKVLNNNSHVTGKWPTEAALWGSEIWFPAMFQAGLQKFAWVQSSDPGSRLSAKISQPTRKEMMNVIQFFNTESEARTWLKT